MDLKSVYSSLSTLASDWKTALKSEDNLEELTNKVRNHVREQLSPENVRFMKEELSKTAQRVYNESRSWYGGMEQAGKDLLAQSENMSREDVVLKLRGQFTKLADLGVRSLTHLQDETFGRLLREGQVLSRALVESTMVAVDEIIKPNPYISLLVPLLIFLGPQPPLIMLRVLLSLLGFGTRGIVRGTSAASYQSRVYGGHTPKGSLFSKLQSMGAAYDRLSVSSPLFLIIRCGSGVFAWYVWDRIRGP